MSSIDILIIAIVVFALIFDFTNGFHDTANAIATVVSTRVLPPRAAILMSASLNLIGAFFTSAVAKTIAGGLTAHADQPMILAAIIGAFTWNMITWYYGIPSSSSHALIGGLIGAALVFGGGGNVIWKGLFDKVLVPLVVSPLAGGLIAFVVMTIIYALFAHMHPHRVGGIFRGLQIFSAAFMSYSHGSNDAQKSMGIITLALVSGHLLPNNDIPTWVVIACAAAMALGTAAGGWRIIKTMGHKIIRLEPVHGFAAETSASIVILLASKFGAPVSTTHVISGSIFGVGAANRLKAVRWSVAQSMIVAWILTIPAAGLVAAVAYEALRLLGRP